MNRFTSILLIIFATCNLLWMIGFPECLLRKADNKAGAEVIVENQTEVDKSNSSETDERSKVIKSTKTRVKSKILPSGGLIEQTVTTEVTETFSSTLCVQGLDHCKVRNIFIIIRILHAFTQGCVDKCLDEIKNKVDEEESVNVTNTEDDEPEQVHEIDDNIVKKLNRKFSPYQKLGTGLSCCISHLVVEESRQWTFHLSGG